MEDKGTANKFNVKWLQGDWPCKTDLNDMHIASASEGAVTCRTVKRIGPDT